MRRDRHAAEFAPVRHRARFGGVAPLVAAVSGDCLAVINDAGDFELISDAGDFALICDGDTPATFFALINATDQELINELGDFALIQGA